MEKIPDEACVIRGVRNSPEDIQKGIGIHPSGITEISVQCAVGLSIEQLVGQVHKAGGDVIRTSGRGYHATLTGLTPEQISNLLTPTIPKPKQQ